MAHKMRMPTLREQGLGVNAIVKVYPEKQWKWSSMQTTCRRIEKTGSAVDRQAGNGRPKSTHTAETETLKTIITFSYDGTAALIKVGKSITFVLHITSIYAVPNIVEIG